MNSLTYAAGDSILFHGGDSFNGCVMINSTSVPNKESASNPITLGSYGSGNATLLSNCPGNLHALLTIDGVSGVTVQNLILSANSTQTAIGILIQNSIADNTVDTVTIQNNDISGFNISGASNYGAEVFVSGFAANLFRRTGVIDDSKRRRCTALDEIYAPIHYIDRLRLGGRPP
jgi:hypothetical protein